MKIETQRSAANTTGNSIVNGKFTQRRLRILDERRPGVGRVSKLRHVERHRCLLLS
jgi:hypothetical protein